MRHKSKIRLYINQDLSTREHVVLDESQSHYLANVMKCEVGDDILCFDNINGEFACKINEIKKKNISLVVAEKTRDYYLPPDLWLLFAPIKKDNTDFIIQKATELGVRKLFR